MLTTLAWSRLESGASCYREALIGLLPPPSHASVCTSPPMSVLSAGPPFHAAALTITSIASNYLAVFPPRRYRPHSSRPGIISVSLGRCHAPSSPLAPPQKEELTCVQTSISGVITSFCGIFYLPSTLHLSPFIAAAAASAAAAAHNTAVFPDKVALTFLRRRRCHCSNKKTN